MHENNKKQSLDLTTEVECVVFSIVDALESH